MDITASKNLQKAQALLDEGEPQAAYKLLKPLYRAHLDNIDIILATVEALEALEQEPKARSLLLHSLQRNPKQARLWGALADLYWVAEDESAAYKTLEKALTVVPEHLELMRQRAGYYADAEDREAMHQQYDRAMAAHPDKLTELLGERADTYLGLAYGAEDDEAQIHDGLGMVYAVVPLQAAVADMTRVIAREALWQNYYKRAGLYKKLQQYDDAIADFDAALAHLDEQSEAMRETIEIERDGCLNNGRNERERLAQTLREDLQLADAKGLSLEDHLANNMINALATQHAEGRNMLALMEEVGDDPAEQQALNVAQEILAHAKEAPADYTPAAVEEFPRAAQVYNRRVGKKLQSMGFQHLGDYEPQGLRQQLGRAVLVSVFLSADRTIAAACYRLTPLKPVWWIWLIQCLLGQWRHHDIIEFESVAERDGFIISNNTGAVNVFTSPINGVDVQALPAKASIDEVLRVHRERLADLQLREFSDAEAIFAEQERLRQLKIEHRQAIGYVTEQELQVLLGKHYDQMAARVKKYLNRLAPQSV
ncbi:tetratricopeptide repeat protein [Gilvimarinus sp. DA14]|uniref:tetratricopeptide repeat protein n=1 Tax=Gilvimarinus sp. DA14 TaxID=2956798 RepID=UPI0020B638FF|nr:tetratricopeptide repeat protein [Gilvimarinus sp. DA14]UTF61798.1 hypothetical protein NHM04_08405 [Gilvimarinus sp. DA14]